MNMIRHQGNKPEDQMAQHVLCLHHKFFNKHVTQEDSGCKARFEMKIVGEYGW